MDSLGPNPKNQMFNSVDVNIRQEFLDSLGGKLGIKNFTDSIRDVAVADFWKNEKLLIKEGKGTFNWTDSQQKIILEGGRPFQGHHMLCVNENPLYAGDFRNIQPLEGNAQAKGAAHNLAHNGYSYNATHGYYDTLTSKMYVFSNDMVEEMFSGTPRLGDDIHNGFPPITNLTEVCDMVEKSAEYNPNWADAFEDLFPGFKKLNRDQKTLVQRLENAWKHSDDTGSFVDFVVKNSANSPSNELSYIGDLSWRSIDLLDFDSMNISSKYQDLLKASDLDEITGKRLKQLIYQLEVKKVDPKSIDMDSLFKDCKRCSPIFEDFRKMQADDVAEIMIRNIEKKGGRVTLKGSVTILSPKDLGIDSWLTKQKAGLVKAMRENPELGKVIGNGGTYIFTALDLVDFADICVDIYLGMNSKTMTEEEAGEKLFSWGCATLLSEAGANVGAVVGASLCVAILPPLGAIAGGLIGGLIGGTLGYVFGKWFGETFYDDIYSSTFNFWDSILSDGNHLLEGSGGNEVFNFAHGEMGKFSIRELFTNPDETDITFYIETKGGDDYVAGYQNDDTLVGGSGSDMLIGCGGDDYIYGDNQQSDYKAESDEISYDDIIYGGSGNDRIYGGAGNDIIYGDGITSQSHATENDVFRMPELNYDEKWMEYAGLFEVFNPYSDLDSTYDDTIFGEDGTDYIFGGQGKDIIHGGNDADIIYGEDGNDELYGGDDDDFIDGGEDDNYIEGGIGNDYIVSGSGNDTIHAMKGNDTIIVESGTNYIVGGTDDDYISCGSGDDTIYGDLDDGVSYLDDGNDVIYGGAGNDTIHAGGNDDFIDAGGGNDRIFGDSGNNEIHCGSGDDKVYGGENTDIIYGGNGIDLIFGGGGADMIYGENSDDKLHGENGDDEIYGGAGDDYITGGYGGDYLYGNDGNDIIYGDGSGDILDGGRGDDELYGGDGDESYFFGYGYDKDTIYDLSGLNHIELGYIDMDAIDLEFSEDKHDLILSLYDSEEGYVLDSDDYTIDYNIKTNDSLCIEEFDKCGEDTYFWIDDESYQVIDENGELVFVQRDVPSRHLGGSFSRGMHGNIKDHMVPNMGNKYDEAGKVQPPRDPLVIYFTESATSELIGINNSDYKVFFDLDRNGFAERTAWIGPKDGFLVLDRNNNGIIDDGGELFSDHVTMSNGKRSESGGFEALADLDDYQKNKKVIDKNDRVFNNLRIWIDANTDGITDSGELHTLDEKNIESISLDYSKVEDDETAIDKELGIRVTDRAVVTFKDKTVKPIAEHWFDVKSYNTQETHIADENTANTSFGNMPSIGNALEQDETGKLAELVEKFNNSNNYAEKHILTRKILYFITGANSIASNSRGGYIDARDLHVIETIMGVESFIGADGANNPNSVAGPILKSLYSDFETLYFNLINLESNSSNYLEMIREETDENDNIVLDLSVVKQKLDDHIECGYDMEEKICGIYSFLALYDAANKTGFSQEFKDYYPDYKAIIDKYENLTYIVGSDKSEKFVGSAFKELFWTEGGNDEINGYGGNDIIYSGSGDDKIIAGEGNDVVYGEDDNDTISGGAGNDIIYGGSGEDSISGDGGNDTIYAEDDNDTVNGGDGDDIIYTGNGDDEVYGDDDNDIIDAGEGNDDVYGGDGNDIIDAGEGNDEIYGGTGNDDMNGGAGNDKFYIDLDHGNDIIRDSEGNATIAFIDELTEDDYRFSVDISNGFVFINKETEETISLPDFINLPLNYTFEFNGEKTILGGGNEINSNDGTDEDETITAGNGFNIIRGNGGADTITGGDGIDFIYGGYGNDIIDGGEGTNIVFGEGGDDTITDGFGDSYLSGGNGNDVIYGYEGNDVLLGGTGDDELHGGNGNDALAGNAGSDYMYGEDGSDVLYGDEGNDHLYGGDGGDLLFGGDGDDELYGDEGNDYLESGLGTDYLYGGVGNDTFVGGEGIKYMYGEEGDDIFYGGNGINYMYGGEGDDVFTGGEEADYIEGGNGNDMMNGGNGNNEMFGQEGNDQIYGGNDNDYIDGGVGDDQLYGGNGENEIYGQDGNDIIYDGDDGSYIYGGTGNDSIYAGGGNDVIDGGEGDDYIQDDHGDDTVIFKAGYGTDTISDAAGNNTIQLSGLSIEDAVMSRINGSDLKISFGDDNIIIKQYFDGGAFQNFNINGTMLNDLITTLYGSDNDDWMSAWNDNGVSMNGGNGNDTIQGGNGNDTLDGGTGNDFLNGNGGNDTYIFSKGSGNDTIEDWNGSSLVNLTDINIDEVSISKLNDSTLVLTVESTGDTLTINGYKWNPGGFTFEFADGTTDTVNKDTWKWESGFGGTSQPDVPVEYIINGTENSDWLSAVNDNGGTIYAGEGDDGLSGGNGSDTLYGESGNDTLYGNDGNDILDGGAGNDILNGANGTDTYIFSKGYGNDVINEWGNDRSIIKLNDVKSDEVTVTDQWGSNLVLSINGTEDTLTISNFKWGQAIYTFEFADGAVASVNKDTWGLEFSQLPTITTEEETVVETSEDDVIQSNSDLLSNIYADDSITFDLLTDTGSTVISDVSNSVSVTDETGEIAEQTDIQTIILIDAMAGFATESNISDTNNFANATDETVTNQLLVGTQVQ